MEVDDGNTGVAGPLRGDVCVVETGCAGRDCTLGEGEGGSILEGEGPERLLLPDVGCCGISSPLLSTKGEVRELPRRGGGGKGGGTGPGA